MKKSTYKVIGVMAGSSMDGLDIALVYLKFISSSWKFELEFGQTVPYDADLKSRLAQSNSLAEGDKHTLDSEFGKWIGQQIKSIATSHVDLIAVHGHTVTHEPENGISWQLGRGDIIAKACKICTVTDFRNEDIALGGQGAPLVPFGDFSLFSQYDACLNLGGICNVSILADQKAWDIGPCNQVLNYFANKLDASYDKDGLLARGGELDQAFYNQLTGMDYFLTEPPKSLANNYINDEILSGVDPKNGLFTYCHFITDQIAKDLKKNGKRLLITGGGANNLFLIELIRERMSDWEVVIPGQDIVDFKEAIIFGFLGVKRIRGEINVLSSTTGASKDSSSGVIHLP